MAASVAVHSYSTTLTGDPAGGTAYAAVGEVHKIMIDGIETGSSNRTNLNSPSAAKEFVAALLDAGSLTFGIRFTKAAFTLLLSNVRKTWGWKITFPLVGAEVTPSTFTCFGHLTKIPVDFPDDDVINMESITVKVTGLPAFNPGS